MLAPTTRAAFGLAWIKDSLRLETGSLTPARGLFRYPAPGTDPTEDTWVHYGFTGTGVWISPAQGRWAVLLTNKLRYNRVREPVAEIRNVFRAAAFAAENAQGS